MKKSDLDDYWILVIIIVILLLLSKMGIWLSFTMVEETVGLPPGWTALNEISDLSQQFLISVFALLSTRDRP